MRGGNRYPHRRSKSAHSTASAARQIFGERWLGQLLASLFPCPGRWKEGYSGIRMPRSEKATRGPEYRMRGIHGRVIQTIAEAIVLGQYAPGALLPRESDLAKQFDASRTAVREAIKVLAA